MKKKIIISICVVVLIMIAVGIVSKVINDDYDMTMYTYKGDYAAEGVEIDKVFTAKKSVGLLKNLESIKNKLLEEPFSDINIELKGISEVEGIDNVLTINLVDGKKGVLEYLNNGSAGSKINLDIITKTFLQPEADKKDWIAGLKVLLDGEKDVEGDHFNLQGVFKPKDTSRILAYITDYGYEKTPSNYDEVLVINQSSQKFLIEPLGKETTLVINEFEYDGEGNFSNYKELLRTDKKVLLEMELPEGGPSISVMAIKEGRTSTWIPLFNGKNGSLIVPEEFFILNDEHISRENAIKIAQDYINSNWSEPSKKLLKNINKPDAIRFYEYRDHKINTKSETKNLKDMMLWMVSFDNLNDMVDSTNLYIDYYTGEIYNV